MVYFEHSIPDVYDGDLTRDDVQHWLHEHKTGGHAVKVTGVMLEELTGREDYVAALFVQENCDTGDPCEEPVAKLVASHDTLRKELGVLLVRCGDHEFVERLLSAKGKRLSPPALGLFRNGDLLMFDGNVESELGVMKFLSDMDSLLLDGAIEEVGMTLLEHMEEETEQGVFVFLYDGDDGRASKG